LKKCNKCLIKKDLTEFYKNSNICKQCKIDYQLKYNKDNYDSEKVSNYNKDYYFNKTLPKRKGESLNK
jgi:hypothetical protein